MDCMWNHAIVPQIMAMNDRIPVAVVAEILDAQLELLLICE